MRPLFPLALLLLLALPARAGATADTVAVQAAPVETAADRPVAVVATPDILVQRRFEMPPEYIAKAHPLSDRVQVADAPLPAAA